MLMRMRSSSTHFHVPKNEDKLFKENSRKKKSRTNTVDVSPVLRDYSFVDPDDQKTLKCMEKNPNPTKFLRNRNTQIYRVFYYIIIFFLKR